MSTERVCNQVAGFVILRIAEAANNWLAIRKIEELFGDQDGAVGRDLRAAEVRMREALAQLPPPPEVGVILAWDAPTNRHCKAVEDVAEDIFYSLPWSFGKAQQRPRWTPHGNSMAQDSARDRARVRLRNQGYTGE